ncbi:nucleotidyltransferase substrate binding protein [Caldithrix abyssi]|nr:nucleotidyltransferase substrate binding protein [Caldithrix abyssi]
MVEARNTLAHTYNEEQAEAVYSDLPRYLSEIKGVLDRISIDK